MTQTATAPATKHHTETAYIHADTAWRIAQNEATMYFDFEVDAVQSMEFANAQAIADSLYQIRLRAWSNMAQWRDTVTQAAAAGIHLQISAQ